MKGYDSLLGSHFDHYTVQYITFEAATPSKADISPPGECPSLRPLETRGSGVCPDS